MSPPILTPTLAAFIPEADLARAVRLAFDTLLSIMTDKAGSVRDKRMAAAAVLRLATLRPGTSRTPASTEPRAHPAATSPPPVEASRSSRSERDHASDSPDPYPAPGPPHGPVSEAAPAGVLNTPPPRPARALVAAAGASRHSPVQPRAA